MIAHYPLNGDANDLVFGNDGTFSGGTFVADHFGNPGHAYQNHGPAGKITIPPSFQYHNLGNITVSLWFKQGFNTQRQLLWKGAANPVFNDTTRQFDIITGYLSTNIHPDVYGKSSEGVNGIGCDAGTIFFDTEWHNFAFTFDGDALTAYYDGEMYGLLSLSSLFLSPISRLFNVSLPLVVSDCADVSVDDLKIYRRTLSAAEIMTEFQAPNPVTAVKESSSKVGESFVVFPNPANEAITLSGPGEIAGIWLIDAVGRESELKLIHPNKANLRDIGAGMYGLKVQTSEGVFMSTLFKP